ncbi:helix-turn-helix domain-containing protein [Chengkuizengella marina]|uniref:XRE family transcriptional regulator n=1 Tax=Chengkuizengella marina TaxID=2507566 RepID=A0A6N9Q2V5_9BACL|nr:helix-turn-helix domain-containing protein [Chengkuizengella marina]NBI29116.1 XRE family transcriptional regulator [Chengkuizengella marina]
MSIVSRRLKEARERKNLRQIQVREKTGINNKTLSGYEQGVSEPDLDTLNVLANLYEVSMDWLMGRIDEKSESLLPKPELLTEEFINEERKINEIFKIIFEKYLKIIDINSLNKFGEKRYNIQNGDFHPMTKENLRNMLSELSIDEKIEFMIASATTAAIDNNSLVVDGEKTNLTNDEAQRIQEELEMYRLLKQKRQENKDK